MHNKRIGRDDLLKIEVSAPVYYGEANANDHTLQWARTPPSASWRFDDGRPAGRRSERSPRRRSGSPPRRRYEEDRDRDYDRDRGDRDRRDRRDRERTRSPDDRDRDMKDRDRDDDRERGRDRDRDHERENVTNGDDRIGMLTHTIPCVI